MVSQTNNNFSSHDDIAALTVEFGRFVFVFCGLSHAKYIYTAHRLGSRYVFSLVLQVQQVRPHYLIVVWRLNQQSNPSRR